MSYFHNLLAMPFFHNSFTYVEGRVKVTHSKLLLQYFFSGGGECDGRDLETGAGGAGEGECGCGIKYFRIKKNCAGKGEVFM